MTADAIYYWLVGRARACPENERVFRRADAIFSFALRSPEMPTTTLRSAMTQCGRGTRPPADANYSLSRRFARDAMYHFRLGLEVAV